MKITKSDTGTFYMTYEGAYMKIDINKCKGCKKCIPLCCGEAIYFDENLKKCKVNQEKCVECDICKISGICDVDALVQIKLKWPRSIRRAYSSVTASHKWMGVWGRGTMEMKNNDVTGKFGTGETGFTIDVGRPGITCTFIDVEKITMVLALIGVKFDELNPTTQLMKNRKRGTIKTEVKNERVLSCIIEFTVDETKTLDVINTLKTVAEDIYTVFSVGCISKCDSNGDAPVQKILDANNIYYRPNAKINIGLGRPLFE